LESVVKEQIDEMVAKAEKVLASHSAAVYLPCYYRAGPPRIFMSEDSLQVLVKRDTVFNPEGHSYDLTDRGFQELGEGILRIVYEFCPGNAFELEIDGVLMEKKLAPGGLAEEIRELVLSLGVFDVVPILDSHWTPKAWGEEIDLRIKKLDPGITAPAYAHPGDAGLDICSAEDVTLEPGERALIGTGFAMALPEGYAAFVQPRSGLAARSGISIVNTPGLIDCHYRGEVKVILVNLGREAFAVKRGDRIAQMVIQRVERARVSIVDELDETKRGEGGFGSTGV
jgi:dUTP pyrophosphatase